MPQIITLAHQKGGVGKSTLTFNLANIFKDNFKVAIFDLDPQGTIYKVDQTVEKIKGIDIFPYLENIEKVNSTNYDFVFIDTPPYLSKNLASIFKLSDLILIPTKAGLPDLTSIGAIIELIKKADKEKQSLIVLSMLKHKINIVQEIKKVLQNYSIELTKTQILDRVVYGMSMITEGVKTDLKAYNEIQNLAQEIIEKLNSKRIKK
jgi:chromosome partitioning protein